MAAELLLDTGAFVALIDRSETRHLNCVRALEDWSGPVVTTEAVLTETLYLLGPKWRPQETCFEFFLRGAFVLVPLSATSLKRAAVLMKKYQDVPMDFADATLVALGEELDSNKVFTLDRRGFSVFRLNGKRPFEVLP
jgi:hypothetical protein